MKSRHTYCLVVAALITSRRDRLHFTPEGYREIGRRYAAAMLPLLGYKAAGSK